MNKPITRIEQRFFTRLQQYDYPGNVRELKNLVEQAMITCDGDVLTADQLYFSNNYGQPVQSVFGSHNSYDLAVIEKNTIEEVLQHCGYNKSKTAQLLNISRQALDRKIKKYKIREI